MIVSRGRFSKIPNWKVEKWKVGPISVKVDLICSSRHVVASDESIIIYLLFDVKTIKSIYQARSESNSDGKTKPF